MDEVLLSVEQVSKQYGRGPRAVSAVEAVSFVLCEGESLGLVGESGSGKSTLAGLVCGLISPSAGSIAIAGQRLTAGSRVRREIWRSVQMIFQDPYSSINPKMRVGEFIAEPLKHWHGVSGDASHKRVVALLEQVGLNPALSGVFPDRLSGGQRQRVSIARALAAEPRLLVCDESVSALDVSVQAQILALLNDLRRDTGISYLFISHDIDVIRLIADRVLVMKDGHIVEELSSDAVTVEGAKHPYTRELLSAVPLLQ